MKKILKKKIKFWLWLVVGNMVCFENRTYYKMMEWFNRWKQFVAHFRTYNNNLS